MIEIAAILLGILIGTLVSVPFIIAIRLLKAGW